MAVWIKNFFFVWVLVSTYRAGFAQENWPTPELARMYDNVHDYKERGNYKQAIITLKQLCSLVSPNNHLRTELGYLYYADKQFEAGADVLATVIRDGVNSDSAYQMLACCQTQLKQYKQAKKTIEEGLKLFPASGMLYYRKGILLIPQDKANAAESAWLTGIAVAPNEPANYKELAIAYVGTEKNVAGLMYFEVYLVMQKDTMQFQSMKQGLFEVYRKLFQEVTDIDAAKQRNDCLREMIRRYKQLTPVVSDGLTTENLTMVRTRFLIGWLKTRDTDCLMTKICNYQDRLIREGWFDIYNEWLFGKAEHEGQFDAWNKFHSGDLQRFEEWRTTHLLKL